MMRMTVFLCLLGVGAFALADKLVVKGELSFTEKGIGKVAECDGGRIFTLGVMASDPYFQLVQKYWSLSDHGKTPVVVEVSGEVTKTSDPGTESTLQTPRVVALLPGSCKQAAGDKSSTH